MQYIDVSGKLPMCCAANAPQVRYSAAYPTGRERIAKGTSLLWGPHSILMGRERIVKVTPLSCGLSTMALLYQ